MQTRYRSPPPWGEAPAGRGFSVADERLRSVTVLPDLATVTRRSRGHHVHGAVAAGERIPVPVLFKTHNAASPYWMAGDSGRHTISHGFPDYLPPGGRPGIDPARRRVAIH